jgi:ubiquinone/menaquinone biosynthesis C-methylase UbiE
MDQNTINTYNEKSDQFQKNHQMLSPTRLYNLAETFFRKGGRTLDLGCGIGRDTKELNTRSFPTIGVDASLGMLKTAKEHYPEYQFIETSLPNLEGIKDEFENIFCCAVLMHIPRSQLLNTVHSILRITKPGGKIILSYRFGKNENDGRLFENYYPGQISQLFESFGGKVHLVETIDDWYNLVVEKTDLNNRDGIKQIQDVIIKDKKTATYKLALIRALCEISRYESNIVTWYREGDKVLIPLKRIAVRWLYYYLPLIQKNINQSSNKNLAFTDSVKELHRKSNDIPAINYAIEKNDNELNKTLKIIAQTIQKGPIKYSGTENKIFEYMSSLDASMYPQLKDSDFGLIVVPIQMWRDICHFSHWIEDSLIIQWAQQTEKLNQDNKFATYVDLITKSVQQSERSTYIIRNLMKNKQVYCAWSGKNIDKFDVDHMIPWSVWRNNDIWNLLPSNSTLNSNKRDSLPSPKLIEKRFSAKYGSIKYYWELYAENFPDLYASQIDRALGLSVSNSFTTEGRDALIHEISKIQIRHGSDLWQP